MTELEQLLTEQTARLREQVARLEEENRLLRQKIDLLVRHIYGGSSEKLDPAQLELLLEGGEGDGDVPGKDEASAPGPEDGDAPAEAGRKGSRVDRERRPRVPDHLPVVEEVIDPEPVRACPEAWRRIGEEVSEQLDYEPARFLKRRTIRRKYVRRADREAPPIIAPLPNRLIEGGIATPGLLVQIVVAKYVDHLPLYRQEQIYRTRHKVDLPRQTMARWIGEVAGWLRPIAECMHAELLRGDYLQIDETPIRYLEPGHGKAKQGYLWTCTRPGHDVVYHWGPGRGRECLEKLLGADAGGAIRFRGVGQSDGYQAYKSLAAHCPELRLAGCWAHARRKFRDAFEQQPSPACAWILRQIQQLYRIEKRLRESRAGPAQRVALRQIQSKPILQRIRMELIEIKARHAVLPKSLLGRAVDYALSQWEPLGVYLEYGQVEIDNNQVENAIRPTAVGKKNWLFIGERGAGWRGAVIYTLVESCRRRGIDPHAYLLDVLTRLPDATNHQIPDLTPGAWAEAKQPSVEVAS